MKKLLIILILFMSVLAYGENSNFYSFGEFAYYPSLVEDYEIPEGIYFSTDIGVGFQYRKFYIELEDEVNMIKSIYHMFQPYKEKYYLRVGIFFSFFNIEYEHMCIHNVDWRGTGGGYDKISIKFDSRRLTERR